MLSSWQLKCLRCNTVMVNVSYYITAVYWQAHFTVRQYKICLLHYSEIELWCCFSECQSVPHTLSSDVWPEAFSRRQNRVIMVKCFTTHIKILLFLNANSFKSSNHLNTAVTLSNPSHQNHSLNICIFSKKRCYLMAVIAV